MAERRMFTKKVTDDDNFMSLSSSAQALYLHLSMCADDDGFCNQVSVSMFKAHASVQDLQALLEKRYVYQFENGVIVIKHWRMANALRKDRYTPTAFQEELKRLDIKDNGSYTWAENGGCQMVAKRLPDGCHSIGKDRKGKNSNKNKHGEFQNVLLSEKELEKLKERFPKDWSERIDNLSIYMRAKGKQYKDHYATILSWARKEQKEKEALPKPIEPKSYKAFEVEDYEKPDFKSEPMPDEIRNKLSGMFGGNG